ncbi:MAG: lipoyl(octanoyl) transferase LipB [Flavobacteriaceae bacterium]|nr:lipoyl(octanoyl) transferase LipB [Flavobacteriaceae bacterium]MCY4266781.1 lipoyl(octanoyl) transferase LipB [Flavobacteriaceae bacterium]MCY4298817.1 lipoyl(octanoyl) transferase LipB [Flavobacteriaceae bacterium]
MKNTSVELIDLGQMSYAKCWEYQQKLLDSIVENKIKNRQNPQQQTKNYFLWVEHPHVYTIGRRGEMTNLLLQEEQLKSKNISFYHTNRGGDITYHGPGQIVGYPILDLENFFTDIHLYLRKMEQSIMDTLKSYGIQSKRSEGETGVWVEKKESSKIAAIGIRTSRWVTMHGFALNVNTDLSYFNHIIPCGILGKGVTSLKQELGKTMNILEVKHKLEENFRRHFGFQWISEAVNS